MRMYLYIGRINVGKVQLEEEQENLLLLQWIMIKLLSLVTYFNLGFRTLPTLPQEEETKRYATNCSSKESGVLK